MQLLGTNVVQHIAVVGNSKADGYNYYVFPSRHVWLMLAWFSWWTGHLRICFLNFGSHLCRSSCDLGLCLPQMWATTITYINALCIIWWLAFMKKLPILGLVVWAAYWHGLCTHCGIVHDIIVVFMKVWKRCMDSIYVDPKDSGMN